MQRSGRRSHSDEGASIRHRIVAQILLCAVLLVVSSSARAAIPAAERQALVDLYNSTDGANWTQNTNWMTAADECTWWGVICNGTTVERLQLGGLNLRGPIPATLANLDNLVYLWLFYNRLNGTIPPALGTLDKLIEFRLEQNELSGSIPGELGQLSRARNIELHENGLTGGIPSALGNLTNLETLTLDRNRLSGVIPTQLGQLTDLSILDLRWNELTGALPAQLGNLTRLQTLALEGNRLSGEIPASFANLTNLQSDYYFLHWNGLHSSNEILATFLNTKQWGASWQSTQTVAPNNVSASGATATSLTVAWAPISYTANSGFYEVSYSKAAGGPYTKFVTTTANKSASSLTITGLTPSTIYYFVVRATTLPHANNGNTVTSEFSEKVSGITLGSGPVAPQANFTWLPSSPKATQEVQFTDASTGVPTSWAWTFGDNGTSASASPTHVFAVAGTYSVKLTATNAGGSHSTTKSVVVAAVSNSPTANFTWTPSSPKAGQDVQFGDTSTGGATSWAWTFGDGGTSTSQNPKHVFTVAGNYSVKLTATNAGGSHSTTKNVSVASVSSAPVARFGWSPASPKAGEEVQFSDTSTGSPTSWLWAFGDGGTSVSRNVKHTFAAADTYSVKLTAANASGSDSVTKHVTVASGVCPHPEWSDLKLARSAIGKELEAFHGNVPDPHPTLSEMITRSLDDRVRELKAQILAAAPNTVFTRLSGYRPPDYQDHLYQLKKLYEAMYKVRGSITAIQCASEIAKVEDEKSFHKLGPQKPDGVEIPGTLAVSKRSNHEYGNALDVSVVPKPGDWAAGVSRNNLLEPCTERAVHLQMREYPVCGASTTVTAVAFVPSGVAGLVTESSVPLVPIRLLLRDPSGRRVGYDAATGSEVNEIGATATYSGVDSDPQVVTVEDAAGGSYHVEAVAVSSGAYTLMLSADDEEHGANFGSAATTGNAVVGNPIDPLGLGVQQTTPLSPGRRRVVRH